MFQQLMDVYKADVTEVKNYGSKQEETLLGDVTEQLFTHLKHGEALDNIKSEAKVMYIHQVSSRNSILIMIFNVFA